MRADFRSLIRTVEARTKLNPRRTRHSGVSGLAVRAVHLALQFVGIGAHPVRGAS